MPDPPPPSTSATTARVLWVAAGALLFFGAFEKLALDVAWSVLGVRAGWAALTALVAFFYPRASERSRTLQMVVLALVTPALFAVLLLLRDDLTGVSFAFFLATPMVFAILLRGEVAATWTAALSTLMTGAALFRWLPGASGGTTAWVLGSVASGAVAVYSSRLYVRMSSYAEQLQQERLNAVESKARIALARSEADRGALLSQVAAGLAHELNNPLGALTSNLAYLESTTAPGASQEDLAELPEVIADARTSASRIAGVVRRLAALAPPATLERNTCEVVATLRSVVDDLPGRAALRTSVCLPTAEVEVALPAHQLRRVLQQLLQGAANTLAAAPASPPAELVVEATADPGHVVVAIRDNARVTRAPEGAAGELRARGADSGLGLMLAREALRPWGGVVETNGLDGGGEQVTLRLARTPTS